MGWNYLSIPQRERRNRWHLGMDKKFHSTFSYACDYLSMLGFKLNHVCKRGYWCYNELGVCNRYRYLFHTEYSDCSTGKDYMLSKMYVSEKKKFVFRGLSYFIWIYLQRHSYVVLIFKIITRSLPGTAQSLIFAKCLAWQVNTPCEHTQLCAMDKITTNFWMEM